MTVYEHIAVRWTACESMPPGRCTDFIYRRDSEMKILLINGSPRGKNSNSLRIASKFIEGVSEEAAKRGETVILDEVSVSALRIEHCRGCFACWRKTPGKCCIQDDMADVVQKELSANLVVWSFPLYYFNVPGMLKNLIDRRLPMALPFMSDANRGYGSGGHDSRYDRSGIKHVIISTCGFYSAEGNYDSVCSMFDHFLGKGRYESIFCGQGELFHAKALSSRTDEYLAVVKRAGAEYASGGIKENTAGELKQLLYPKEVFEKMADASWGVNKETGEKEPEDLTFTKHMAALYNKAAYDGKDRVLEMHYTDLDKTYQILLGKDGSTVFTDNSRTATTRINTPFKVWRSISNGEISSSEALGKRLFTVDGDFSLMTSWNRFFGSACGAAGKEKNEVVPAGLKRPSMLTMLIPWITLWVAVSSDVKTGSLITLVVVALTPLARRGYLFTIWDRLSLAAVGILAAAAVVTGDGHLISNIGYLLFGLMWIASCFTKEPLCASYVKYGYGGDKALGNPLFMKTNYILAACWGVLYVLTAIWTWAARSAGYGNTTLIVINNIIPAVMGYFTVWFQKWYPARMARGK